MNRTLSSPFKVNSLLLKSGLALGFLAIVLIVAVCRPEQRAWEKAVETDSLGGYETYVARYREGDRSDLARQRITQFRLDAAWLQTQSADSPEAYRSFVASYPDSTMQGLALERIASLEATALEAAAQAAWPEVELLGTLEAYRSFVVSYPDSSFQGLALERIAFEAAKVVNTTEAFKAYLEQFPGGRYESDALATIEKLRPIRGKLFGLYAPGDGRVRFYLKVGDDLYDLDLSAAREFVGDEDGSFQVGGLYDVVGSIGPRSFLTDSVGTIAVVRTIYVGKE